MRKGQKNGNLIFKKGKSDALKFKKERNVFEEAVPVKVATVTQIRKKKHERKVLVGHGEHYFTKASVAQFTITGHGVKEGDEILIAGPSTGEERMVLSQFKVNGKDGSEAVTGDKITFKVPFRIRLSDRMYLVRKEN